MKLKFSIHDPVFYVKFTEKGIDILAQYLVDNRPDAVPVSTTKEQYIEQAKKMQHDLGGTCVSIHSLMKFFNADNLEECVEFEVLYESHKGIHFDGEKYSKTY